jgi:large repetitive protein
MDRKLPTAKGFLLFCLGLFLTISFDSIGQKFTYTSGALSVDITLIHPCSGNNGVIFFTVNSVDPSQTQASLVVLGPVNVFPQVNIAPGATYTFNASQNLPVGSYDWIIGDNVTTIGSLAAPPSPKLVLQNISIPPLSITKDIETNNPSCITPGGQIQGTIVGGSQTIGIGSYQYKWTADNGSLPVAGFTGVTDGATPLNLATLLGVGGLRGGTYSLEVSDDFSRCDVVQTFTITDPSPTIQTITNQSPPALSICTGDQITVILGGSEVGVTYEILRNGSTLPTPITFIGTGVAPFIMTFPHTQFASGNSILVQATNGFCTTVPMSGNISLLINPLPTITGLTAASVCQGSTSTGLSYTSTSGSPDLYSIDYDALAEAQGFTDVVNALLVASPVTLPVPGAAAPGIYNGSVTVRNSTTTCNGAPIPITVTIISNPTITLGANPSVCLGTTVATLGYSATTGTPNQYSINFDGLAEAQGFVDVSNVALPATPISINIPGSAGVGSYNATITVRNSITGCTSSPVQPIALTINANPTITLGANPIVCAGILTVDLGYTATTSSPNQYSIDFNGTAEAQGFIDVSNATLPASPIVINVPLAPTPGVYVGSITVLNTATGCVSAPQAISVTVIASPTITLGPNPSVCIGSTSANLGYTGTTNAPNQYSINFDAIAEGQGFVDIVNVVLPASPIAINIPGAVVAGTYNATLSVTNTITGCTSLPQPITVTVEPLPTITLGPNPSVCIGTLTAALGYTATTGSPDQYSIDFNGAAELQGFVDVVNAALPATPISITVPGAAATGLYTATITLRNSTTGCVSVSSPISITIDPTPTITLGANPSVCVGTLTANLGYTATTGTPNQYSINFNVAAEAQGFVDVVNAALPVTPIVITVPATALPGIYNATITVLSTGTGCISTPNAISVTIIANPTITLGANPSVCIGSTTANLGYTGTTGSPNQYNIDFDVAAQGQGFVDIVNAALPATPIIINIPGVAVAGTYNGTLTVVNTIAGCTSSSQPITVTINPIPTISLGPNPTVCSGALSALLAYTATTGSPDQYSIDFNAGAELQGFVDVTNAALPATPISITVPAAALAGNYTATITVRNSTTGCISSSNPISVTIDATPTITLGTNPSVCIGGLTADLGFTATTGSPNQYNIDFNAVAEAQGFVDVVNAALPSTPIVINVPGAALAGSYNATISVLNTTTGCTSIPQAISITIITNPDITLGANPSICIGSPTANLTYTTTTGTPNQYSIDFDPAAEAQGFVDVSNVALPASPIIITVPGAAMAGVYNGTLRVSNTVTGCVSATQAVSVTINPIPTITLGTNPNVCRGTLTAPLGYSATTGSPDQYNIDFNAAAEAQGFVDVVNAALPATPISLTIPGSAGAGLYNATLTVRNSTTGCLSSVNPISITIEAPPTITLGSNAEICSGNTTANLTYSATTGSPNEYSIDFNPAAEAEGFADVVNAPLTATPIVIAVPPGAQSPRTYAAQLTVVNTVTGCVSSSQGITIRINAIPTITLGANPSVCAGATVANLGYTATTDAPDLYSINFDAIAEAQGFVDVVNAALPATPIQIVVPGAANTGVYNATLTVSNNAAGCSSLGTPITVTINATPTLTVGTNPVICSGITSTSLFWTDRHPRPIQHRLQRSCRSAEFCRCS